MSGDAALGTQHSGDTFLSHRFKTRLMANFYVLTLDLCAVMYQTCAVSLYAEKNEFLSVCLLVHEFMFH